MGELGDEIREMVARILAANAAEEAQLEDPAEWPRRIIVHPDRMQEIAAAVAASPLGSRYVVHGSPAVPEGSAILLPAITSPDAPETLGASLPFLARLTPPSPVSPRLYRSAALP